MARDYTYLTDSVTGKYPVIISEFNAHTSADWDQINTSSDDPTEASRLASQILNLVASKAPSIYVFKFSMTPSFSAKREIAKNGIHFGENFQEPYHIG